MSFPDIGPRIVNAICRRAPLVDLAPVDRQAVPSAGEAEFRRALFVLLETLAANAVRMGYPKKRWFGQIEEVAMATGWAGDGAVQDQIDSTVEDAVQRARSQLGRGESLSHCEECGEKIPEARRQAVPGVRLCIKCQAERDKEEARFSGYNRRGSKDSQLR
jgi:phage/conjugal plasmid C-4 type zinc finger TraR family protein